MNRLHLGLAVLVGVLSPVASFSPSGILTCLGRKETSSVMTSLEMAKRKMSMTEKRRRRQAKQQTRDKSYENLPPTKLDFMSEVSEDDDSPERFKDPTEAAEKAKDLLKSQRESVDMLTMVTEKLKALPTAEILSALSKNEFFVVDDFLCSEGTLASLEAEAHSMFENEEMEMDTANLGAGEYIVSIKGGKEQYNKCPRSVELVVSTTKHVPDVLESLALDGSACMATFRAFDNKTLKASMNLLLGNGEKEINSSTRDFGKVVDGPEDMRRLTLFYYIVPPTWSETCGGGLIFENASVSAKRDRLVIWKSDSTLFKKELWKGDGDSNTFGSCIELHLVSNS
mmetsp:Transcript_12883/g.30564  ORF Transcript_12883/g.30564 Transcript_12883/m.30564 type:complete len:341 (+) Transcript_12883:67-1089(+)|eukprot:CAMPEP_0113623462 /NCGR_PEP_ID=MMETSP0017_2-20120614/12069_1 /TAXON_ID=2856 /ORGANISM="Cylindrotheca closterium" /LENGTH=340 /DNA_ID=CAMNT_0000533411 /DNA_START=24 /DNA_END=1046 /DNA_ORIENTATION=- /assembly_acc=CAM_ASM_000147